MSTRDIPDVGMEKRRDYQTNETLGWFVTTGYSYMTPAEARDYADEILNAAFECDRLTTLGR